MRNPNQAQQGAGVCPHAPAGCKSTPSRKLAAFRTDTTTLDHETTTLVECAWVVFGCALFRQRQPPSAQSCMREARTNECLAGAREEIERLRALNEESNRCVSPVRCAPHVAVIAWHAAPVDPGVPVVTCTVCEYLRLEQGKFSSPRSARGRDIRVGPGSAKESLSRGATWSS